MAAYNSICKKISSHLELVCMVFVRSNQTYSFIWKAKCKVLVLSSSEVMPLPANRWWTCSPVSSLFEEEKGTMIWQKEAYNRMRDLPRLITQTSSRMRTRMQVLSTRAFSFYYSILFFSKAIRLWANREQVIMVLRVIKFLQISFIFSFQSISCEGFSAPFCIWGNWEQSYMSNIKHLVDFERKTVSQISTQMAILFAAI